MPLFGLHSRAIAGVMSAALLCAGGLLFDRALSQDASNPVVAPKTTASGPDTSDPPRESTSPDSDETDSENDSTTASRRMLGPALTVPREILDMLEQRKRHLDRREATLRGSEDRLSVLKSDLEQILTKYEKLSAAQKRKAEEVQKLDAARKLKDDNASSETRNLHQAQLAKIYEAMPAEEAAARLERMPERKAIELLRILKGKSAGAILASVKPERAARLTEQLLTPP